MVDPCGAGAGRGPGRRQPRRAPTPTRTSTPASRSRAMPAPATFGSGSASATTTRTTPAASSASAQGGVRPWWEQGSRVTQAVAPAVSTPDSAAAASATASACNPPAGWVAPSNSDPSAVWSTQPTHGLGGVSARTDAPSCRARVMRSRSVAVVMSSPGPAGPRAGTTMATSTRLACRASSLPSGLSPSAPGSHRIGRPTGCEEVRGLHRRSGLPPNPARVCSVVL